MSQPIASLSTRSVPGKYKPIAELGRGGMATVFLAVVQGPAGFNKLQVVKRLRPSLAADPEFLNMFVEEARLAARITHPNVVQTNEVGFDGQYYFIAMEYLDGQALEAIHRKVGDSVMPLPLHLHVLCETLAGLHSAHELVDFDGSPLNVVHRDVSPHNVMVTYDGHVKILDFGIAKAADSSADTRTGIMKGKCAYMAPEQFGGRVVDRRADVFAAGIILWQAITGTRLWKGLSDSEIFAKLSMGEIPRPRSVKKDAPEQLDEICMKALAVDRDDRYATAADFQAALEGYLSAAPRVSPRDLGGYVKEHFAQNRAAIRAAIEAELSKPAMPAALSSSEVPVLWQLVPEGQGAAVAPDLTTEAPAPRPARLALYGLVALVALGVGAYAALHKKVAAQEQTPTASGAPANANPPASALVHLTLHASPDEAKIFLDDTPLPGNPATGSFVKDGASHRIRVEAPGYLTKHDFAVFDSSTVTMDVALDRERPQTVGAAMRPGPGSFGKRSTTVASSAPAQPPAAADPQPPPPAPTAAPTAPAEPKKPVIDTSDPWAKKGP